MSTVATFAVPHPALAIPSIGRGDEVLIASTVAALRTVSQAIAAIRPECVVILTPHGTEYSDYIHISPGTGSSGSFAAYGDPDTVVGTAYDRGMITALVEETHARRIHAGTAGERSPALDYATMVPLYFIHETGFYPPIVRVSSSGMTALDHYRFGQCITAAAARIKRRCVVIASGNCGHRLQKDGPYGFCPEALAFDKTVCEAFASGDFGMLLSIDARTAHGAVQCGLRPFVMMAGALDGQMVNSELLSYEIGLGVGYATAQFVPVDSPDSHVWRQFGRMYEQKQEKLNSTLRLNEGLYVRLARKALEHWVMKGNTPPLAALLDEGAGAGIDAGVGPHTAAAVEPVYGAARPGTAGAGSPGAGGPGAGEARNSAGTADSADLMGSGTIPYPGMTPLPGVPAELTQTRQGAMVSVYKDGVLRGCTGTLEPARFTLADEIIHNAASVAAGGPRSPRVQPSELGSLSYTVDIMGSLELVNSTRELDPNNYGVVVSTPDGRRAVLMPRQTGIYTAEKQLEAACRQAGINLDEFVTVQRFKVVRHE